MGPAFLPELPYEFFDRELRRLGIEPPPAGDLAVGQLYFRQDQADRDRAKAIILEVLTALKLEVLTFRTLGARDR